MSGHGEACRDRPICRNRRLSNQRRCTWCGWTSRQLRCRPRHCRYSLQPGRAQRIHSVSLPRHPSLGRRRCSHRQLRTRLTPTPSSLPRPLTPHHRCGPVPVRVKLRLLQSPPPFHRQPYRVRNGAAPSMCGHYDPQRTETKSNHEICPYGAKSPSRMHRRCRDQRNPRQRRRRGVQRSPRRERSTRRRKSRP